MKSETIHDVAVIGAGPAGVAAAVQLKRQGRSPLLLERGEIGGLLRSAHLVENYPGFPDGSPGPDLARTFALCLDRWGVRAVREDVIRLDREADGFEIETGATKHRSRAVIVASGTKPRRIEFSGASPEIVDRIHDEIHALRGVQGRRIAIAGGGDAAFDYALSLCEFNRVTILLRGNRIRALELLRDRALARTNIECFKLTEITGISRSASGALILSCSSSNGGIELRVDALLLSLGRDPRLDFVSERVRTEAEGTEGNGRLHLVGDVRNGRFRQTAIAVGDGIRAAMHVHESLIREDT
jgi:thioredoxin reductase